VLNNIRRQPSGGVKFSLLGKYNTYNNNEEK